MITQFSDLIPILPLLLVTLTAAIAMLSIAIKRNNTLCCAIVIIGLSFAALSALLFLPDVEAQVTPLLLVDKFSLLFTLVICLAAVAIAILSYPYLFALNDNREEYYLLLSIATVGALVMVSSSHFVSAILGIETLSMALYGMLAYPLHSKESVKYPIEASLKYLVLSAVASAVMLFGIALIYFQTGSMAFDDISSRALTDEAPDFTEFLVIGLIMVSAGAAFKLSLAPLHMWTPDVYEGAPTPSAAYLASVGKIAMFVLVMRYFSQSHGLSYPGVVSVITTVAVLSILLGNLLALMQQNLKRLLAYSSIAHMGYLLIALLASEILTNGGALAIEATSFYLVAYVIMTLGAFAVVSLLSSSENEFDTVDDYQGFFWTNPWLAMVFIAMLLSLAGIPLTAGFIGKFYLFTVGVEAEYWILLAALIVGSGIGLYYYLRVIYRMLESLPPAKQRSAFRESGIESISSHLVLAVLLLLVLIFGIFPSGFMTLLESVAKVV